MSELGRHSRRFDDVRVTSAFALIATRKLTLRRVSNGPQPSSCSAASRSTGTSRGGDFFAASALSRRFRALSLLFLPALRVPPYARSQKINQRQRLAHAASSSSATVAVRGKLKLIRGSARAIGNGAHRRSSNLRAALGPSLRRRSNGHRFQTDDRTAESAGDR